MDCRSTSRGSQDFELELKERMWNWWVFTSYKIDVYVKTSAVLIFSGSFGREFIDFAL